MSTLATAPAAAASLVEGEFAFTARDFRRISLLLHSMAGISLVESKSTLVYSRLAKRLRVLGLGSFAEYCALLDEGGERSQDERRRMVTALTTNVTRFFREPHHFDHLAEHVIAPAAGRIRAGGRLRLWSAGCSTGQEPYSIALTVVKALPEAADLDVRILATDIDPDVVAKGRAATYDETELAGVPPELRNRWMERCGDRWRIVAALRGLVAFRELNLVDEWPVKGPFDAIFCRNVVIYFDEPTQDSVWRRFEPLIAPAGRLYIGHSERVPPSVTGLESDGLTAYRRTEGLSR
jgi:chemotaxis protein methyltransferase CheR